MRRLDRVGIYFGVIAFIVVLLSFSSAIPADANTAFSWAKAYGNQTEYLRAASPTYDQGYIMAGMTFTTGSGDILILKVDHSGAIQWQKTYGGSNFDTAIDIQQTPDNGYLVLASTYSFGGNSLWMLKLDVNGNMQWQKTYPGFAYSFGQTSDGGYIIGAATGNAYYSDTFLIKLDAEGNIQWLKIYSNKQYDAIHSVQQTFDGGYIICGSSGAVTYTDTWVVKLDTMGNIEWQKAYIGSNGGMAYNVRQTVEGEYIISGRTSNHDAWLMKLDAEGSIQWQKAYGGDYIDFAETIRQTQDGGYLVGGTRAGDGTIEHASWVMRLDSEGNIQWQKIYDLSLNMMAFDQTPDGGSIVITKDRTLRRPLLLKLNNTGGISGCAGGMVKDYDAIVTTPDAVAAALSIRVAEGNVTPQVTDVAGVESNFNAYGICAETAPDISVSPANLDFGSVELATSTVRAVTISNIAHSDLLIDSITLTGANASEFIQTNNCSIIAPNGSCTITVSFAPLSLGGKNATLSVSSNDPDTPTVDVPIAGTGIDTAPPVTAVKIAGRTGNNDWYVSDVTVALTATDSGSGVKEIHYSVNGVRTVVLRNPASFTINTDGIQMISYYATDNAGNSETQHSITVNIDKTPPVIDLSVSPGMLWPPNHKMVDALISGNAQDPLSDVSSVVFAVSDEYGTVQPTVSGFNTTIPLEAWREGTDRDGRHYTLTAVVTDKAGNKSTSSVTVLVPHDMR